MTVGTLGPIMASIQTVTTTMPYFFSELCFRKTFLNKRQPLSTEVGTDKATEHRICTCTVNYLGLQTLKKLNFNRDIKVRGQV